MRKPLSNKKGKHGKGKHGKGNHGRTTPKGTQDPRVMAREEQRSQGILDPERIRGIHKGTPATLDDFEKEYGVRPAALPGSGLCMSCGRELVKPPVGRDRDHSVCHDCFPEDLRDEWEGRKVDFARYDMDRGTIEEVTMPEDPFTETEVQELEKESNGGI